MAVPIPRPRPAQAPMDLRPRTPMQMGAAQQAQSGGGNFFGDLWGAANRAYEAPLGQLGLSLLLAPTRSAQGAAVTNAAQYAGERSENRKTREQQQAQFDAEQALAERRIGVSEGNLGLRRQELQARLDARRAEREAEEQLANTLAPMLQEAGINMRPETVGALMRSPRGQDFLFSQMGTSDTFADQLREIDALYQAGQMDDETYKATRRGAIMKEFTGSAAMPGGPEMSLNLPGGYQPVYDENNRFMGVEPIPGSPAAREMRQAEQAEENRRRSKIEGSEVVLRDVDRALEVLDEFLPAAGMGSNVIGVVSGSPRRRLEALLDSVRAKVAFSELQRMREASPTGGALGQVTERELQLLSSALGSLDPDQGEAQLRKTLMDVRRHYSNVVDLLNAAGSGEVPSEPSSRSRRRRYNPNTGEFE